MRARPLWQYLCGMFIKAFVKQSARTGERKTSYRLVESRRVNGCPRHRNVLHLGDLADLPGEERKNLLARRITELVKHTRNASIGMFKCDDEAVESLAQKFFAAIKSNGRLDLAGEADYHLVDLDSVGNRDVREVGPEWLCKQALDQLGIGGVFDAHGWDGPQKSLALAHIISRACHPASELGTCKWIRANSAVCELTGQPLDKVTKDALYKTSLLLYGIKGGLEAHLGKRTNELFDLRDRIIIYDLTNTYFEGKMADSKMAKYGRSKEKRSDAKIVVLAAVVNVEGFIKHSQIFEGNLSDGKSLERIIGELNAGTGHVGARPTVVLDAGAATEANVRLLGDNGYKYICVSRSGMKKYAVDASSAPVTVADKKGGPITLQRMVGGGGGEHFVCVHSLGKEAKEGGMNGLFQQRFEEGLAEIRASLSKKSGTKRLEKVWERIGRLKEKYPSIHKYYAIGAVTDRENIVTELAWSQKETDKQEGRYLIRTNLDDRDEKTCWEIYNTIREIESTFRVLKTDLDLRPIYHKTDAATMAHLHLGLLAYWVVNTVRHQLKAKGINNEWRDIVRIMNTQKLVTTTMENDCEQLITIRQCSEPTDEAMRIYNALGYKPRPFSRKKFVVPLAKIRKVETVVGGGVRGG